MFEKNKEIDNYIMNFSDAVQDKLNEMRSLIIESAPDAKETISWNMPAYKLNGVLVYFAAFKKHISLFPTGADLEPFEEELLDYKRSKGTIQFPLNEPLPQDLIKRIVKHRVKQNLERIL